MSAVVSHRAAVRVRRSAWIILPHVRHQHWWRCHVFSRDLTLFMKYDQFWYSQSIYVHIANTCDCQGVTSRCSDLFCSEGPLVLLRRFIGPNDMRVLGACEFQSLFDRSAKPHNCPGEGHGRRNSILPTKEKNQEFKNNDI